MRPEHTAPPEVFYNIDEAKKYSRNTRIMEIQATMSERAIEMLCLPEDQPSFILDIGCGSGLSGECLSEQGHHWVGMDISEAMLDVAVSERETDGYVVLKRQDWGFLEHSHPFLLLATFNWLIWVKEFTTELVFSTARFQFRQFSGFAMRTRKATRPLSDSTSSSKRSIHRSGTAPERYFR